MNRRNWLDLSRKLVDQFDLDYTVAAMQAALGQYALGFFGEGVLITTEFPSPFPITMDSGDLGGDVGFGVAYDPNGQITQILPSTTTSQEFTIAPNTSGQPRWDLLVMDYVMTGDTLVPQPSDPIVNIDLNLHDDFVLRVIEGTPSGSPVYPAKGQLDIILAGLRVPTGATMGTQVTVDLSVRENAQPFIATMPVFIDETPAGIVNGSNVTFTLSEMPISSQSVLVFLDDVRLELSQYSLAGQTLTLAMAPALGQHVTVWYVENSPMSENPLAGVNLDIGVGNGITTVFPFAGTPVSKPSVMVYVDGLKVDSSTWSLVLGSSTSSIEFTNPPANGQEIAVFFLVNAATLGIGPSGSGVQSVSNAGTGTGQVLIGISANNLSARNIKQGANITVTQVADDIVISGPSGSNGGYVVYGSPTPLTINPAVAIAMSTDQRQLRFIRSTSGAQTMSSTPQLSAGSAVGQEALFFGTDNVNYITLVDGNGLALNGPVNLTNNQSLGLVWNGTVWAETFRR